MNDPRVASNHPSQLRAAARHALAAGEAPGGPQIQEGSAGSAHADKALRPSAAAAHRKAREEEAQGHQHPQVHHKNLLQGPAGVPHRAPQRAAEGVRSVAQLIEDAVPHDRAVRRKRGERGHRQGERDQQAGAEEGAAPQLRECFSQYAYTA